MKSSEPFGSSDGMAALTAIRASRAENPGSMTRWTSRNEATGVPASSGHRRRFMDPGVPLRGPGMDGEGCRWSACPAFASQTDALSGRDRPRPPAGRPRRNRSSLRPATAPSCRHGGRRSMQRPHEGMSVLRPRDGIILGDAAQERSRSPRSRHRSCRPPARRRGGAWGPARAASRSPALLLACERSAAGRAPGGRSAPPSPGWRRSAPARPGCASRTARRSRPRGPFSASRMLSATDWLSNTVGFWNLRAEPSSAIAPRPSGLVVHAVVDHLAGSGGSCRWMQSFIVVLPAPFGPMIARISPGIWVRDRPRRAGSRRT